MNLTLLKQQAREEWMRAVEETDMPETDDEALIEERLAEVDRRIDIILDKFLDTVEASVVPEQGEKITVDGMPMNEAGVGGFNQCRTAVLEAFAKFRGV